MTSEGILVKGNVRALTDSFKTLKYRSPTDWKISIRENEVGWWNTYIEETFGCILLLVNGLRYKNGRKQYIELFEGIVNEIEVKIINCSDKVLSIQGITIDPPFKFNLNEFGFKFPIEIFPNCDFILSLKLVPTMMINDIIESRISINFSQIHNKKIEFLIKKKKAQEFDGLVAVNIGVYNTIVSYKNHGNTGFIPLEKITDIERGILSPTVIRYEKVTNRRPKIYSIGEIAKILMCLNPKSSVQSVINYLGQETKLLILPVDESSGVVYFTPIEVISHILKRIKEKIENFLKKKVIHAVFTYPTEFNTVQIDDFKQAIKLSGFEDIKIIGEAEATAFDYIVGKSIVENPYYICVLDIKESHTNISLLKTLENKNDERRVIDVVVLDSDINRTLGDNQLTKILIEIIEEKINNLDFDVDYNDKEALKKKFYFREEAETDDTMIKIMPPRGIDWEFEVRRNRTEMWQNAEEWKILLSSKDEVDASMSLRFIIDDELVPFTVGFHIKRTEFGKKIEEKVGKLVDKLKRMVDKTGKQFDLILLSGISSQINLIHPLIYENFYGLNIKCVGNSEKGAVLGALHYYEAFLLSSYLNIRFNRGNKSDCF